VSPLPIWLPHTHIRFNYADYGLEQAVGAIKARVQENGGAPAPLTALKRADLYAREVRYINDKKDLASGAGIQIVNEKVSELFREIERLCAEISSKGSLSIRVGSQSDQCVVTSDHIGMVVTWPQRFTNDIQGCSLAVREFNRRMPLPGEHLMFLSEPRQLRETRFVPELSRAREYGWIEKGKPQFLSSAALANKCVIQFVDLAESDKRGEITRPLW
jgi:hypothetical protein